MFYNCKTWLSFRWGTLSTEKLVEMAAQRGLKLLGLTNINSTADCWDFVDFCRKKKIKPIVGTEIRNDSQLLYILLAKNDNGLLCINRFLSQFLQRKEPFPARPEGLVDVWVIYPFETGHEYALKPDERLGVRLDEIRLLARCEPSFLKEKAVWLHPVTFSNKMDFNIHRLLRAIDKNTLLSKLDPKDTARIEELFIDPAVLKQSFADYPNLETNTQKMLADCFIETKLWTDKNKKQFLDSEVADNQLLEQLALEGMRRRYHFPNQDKFPDETAVKLKEEAEKRVHKELEIIRQMGFTAYFLVAWDIVRYAREKGLAYVGRGSGANSIVAYCLRITEVDPIRLDLYFERFLNPSRTSPPDFDMDFSWDERDQIIQYVFEKYGTDHVSLLGMYDTFQNKAAIRELGKVFGLPPREIEDLIHHKGNPKSDDLDGLILRYAERMQNFPNHLSIHAGGILISDQSIFQYTATEMPPKGFQTAQIDMFLAEKIGLAKLDVLSQRGLGHIKEAVALIKQTKGIDVDIADTERFFQDPNIAHNLREGHAIGCFYIESPGMRQLLKKLDCREYKTLVAASSIIRPGVSQSGMMRKYIYYHHHPDEVKYLHPSMASLLSETYGVMVYQEDVIKVAHYFAGLSMADADILRRAMSGKYRSKNTFKLIQQRYWANCRAKGYSDELTAEVWREMESFGGYSFSKAHSASYAVESYQSLFLKTYYPVEFLVAVINNFGGFYSTELYFHQLKKAGAEVFSPCVNKGNWLTGIVEGKVFVGFIHVNSLERKIVQTLIEERQRGGVYLNLTDFVERTGILGEQLNILIKIGAFGFTGKSKKELLWEAVFLMKEWKKNPALSMPLFKEKPQEFQLPDLSHSLLEDAYNEIELLGFPLCDPFLLVDVAVEKFTLAAELPQYKNRMVTVLGYYVTWKRTRTRKGERMFFGTFLDAAGDWIDTVHFPKMAAKFPLQGKGFYKIRGQVIEEFGVYTINVRFMEKVGVKKV